MELVIRMDACVQAKILTCPVQNVGQTSFKAAPAPWGSHAERYGERTAKGMAAGLNGVAVQEKARTAVTKRRSLRRAPTSISADRARPARRF